MKPLTVAIRLDGVLAVYDVNRGPMEIGRPIPGAKAFLDWLVTEAKCFVIIETGRRRIDLVDRWMRMNEIPYHLVNQSIADESTYDRSHQVMADLYIGRDYLRFTNNSFNPLVAEVLLVKKTREAEGPDRTYMW